MLTLIVKNFGVLKDINIELNKTNLFIGENGSGKSVLAKLITIMTDSTINENAILKSFKDYNIDYLSKDSYIELNDNKRTIVKIKSNLVTLHEVRLEDMNSFNNLNTIMQVEDFVSAVDEVNSKNKDKIIFKQDAQNGINNYKRFKPKYIPAERNLISLFNRSLSNLITSDIPLPKELLDFSSQYNNARNDIKELNILDMVYKFKNGQDEIYYDAEKFLPLENSSSGIQTALPLYVTIRYFNKKHEDIIIEEPEQNLYPKAQVDTIKFIIENSSENVYLMTHSPYVLSTLNILLFAYKASNKNHILKEKISNIIPKSQQINPDEFSAYFIKNGISESIKGKSTGMISENAIDEVGDIIDDEFNELMEIYREFKND